MSLSDTIDKIDTCMGNADDLETKINELYDYIPEEYKHMVDDLVDGIQDLHGCISWAKDEAKNAQDSLDSAYSTIQNIL